MKVNELVEFVVAGLKVAVTPVGKPDTVRLALPLNPFSSFTVMVLLSLDPGRKVRVLAEDERLKSAGSVTVRVTAVLLLRAPDVPVTVTVWEPGVAALLAAKVNELTVVVVAGLNVAVTPFGSSEAANATLLLNPFWPFTLMVLFARDPGGILSELAEGERLKLGAIESCTILFAQPVTMGNRADAQKIANNFSQS